MVKWQGFACAAAAAIGHSGIDATRKLASQNLSSAEVVALVAILDTAFLFSIITYLDLLPHPNPLAFLSWKLIEILITSSLAKIFASVLYQRALQVAPLSSTIPFLAFIPVLLLGTSFFLLHEVPNLQGLVGVVVVTAGGFMLAHAAAASHSSSSGPSASSVTGTAATAGNLNHDSSSSVTSTKFSTPDSTATSSSVKPKSTAEKEDSSGNQQPPSSTGSTSISSSGKARIRTEAKSTELAGPPGGRMHASLSSSNLQRDEESSTLRRIRSPEGAREDDDPEEDVGRSSSVKQIGGLSSVSTRGRAAGTRKPAEVRVPIDEGDNNEDDNNEGDGNEGLPLYVRESGAEAESRKHGSQSMSPKAFEHSAVLNRSLKQVRLWSWASPPCSSAGS